MCGRYALWGIDLLGGRFLVIDPETRVPVAFQYRAGMDDAGDHRVSPNGNHIAPMQWGFVPHWSKDSVPSGRPIINARAESLREKPMFRMLLQQNAASCPRTVGSTSEK
jgi:putative SOS response-associated peptidase YedK